MLRSGRRSPRSTTRRCVSAAPSRSPFRSRAAARTSSPCSSAAKDGGRDDDRPGQRRRLAGRARRRRAPAAARRRRAVGRGDQVDDRLAGRRPVARRALERRRRTRGRARPAAGDTRRVARRAAGRRGRDARRAGSLFVIGRGATFAVAAEAALKLKETSAIHAEAFSSAEVLHGPAGVIGPGFPVLGFAPADAARDGFFDTVDRLASFGAAPLIVDVEPHPRWPTLVAPTADIRCRPRSPRCTPSIAWPKRRRAAAAAIPMSRRT